MLAAVSVGERFMPETRAKLRNRRDPQQDRGTAGLSTRLRGPLVLLGLLTVALGVYLPYALKAGWYYDDWSLYSSFRDAGGSWSTRFNACASLIPGGRKLTCLYHVTEYQLLGDHRTAYHLVAIAFLVAMAGLAYAILRRCRIPWVWAALISALLIVFPASDSTRLWPTGAIGLYVMVLELAGVRLVLSALGRPSRPRRFTLHAAGTLLFLMAMLSYEIAVPLVALNGIVYWAAFRNRAALWRGAVDLALAGGFVLYRLALAPPDPNAGFTVHRTVHGDLTRARTLVESAWGTWHATFMPGMLGVIGIIAVLAGASVLSLREVEMRRRCWPWFGLLAGSLAVAGVSTFAFLTANDLYFPQVSSVFNRVTLPASIAYVCLFVALLGLGYEIVRRFVPVQLAATLAVALVALVSVWHQLRISTDHKRSWEASWSEQKTALAGYAVAMRGIPHHSRIIGMGAPIWEPGFIPVFAAPWDLAGAIDYTTAIDPPVASPLVPTMVCGERGMVLSGTLFTPYLVPGQPLYFLNSTRRAAIRVRSQVACEDAITRWGRPPFFATTLAS